VWGRGTNEVRQEIGRDVGLTPEDAPPGNYTEVRAHPAVALPISDLPEGQIVLYWREDGCD